MKKTIFKIVTALAMASSLLGSSLLGNAVLAAGDPEPVYWIDSWFQDMNLKDWLRTVVDINGDGRLIYSEYNNVTSINVSGKEISSLEGIGIFHNLIELDCSNNSLTELDVSRNTKLKRLYCSKNQIKSLNFKYNTNLKTLECEDNCLTIIDLSMNYNLEQIICYNNEIRHLDIGGCPTILNQLKKDGLIEDDDVFFTGGFNGNIYNMVIDKMTTLINVPASYLPKYDIDENIPDPVFNYYVYQFDRDGDGKLNYDEYSKVTEINVEDKDIKSLEGIWIFRDLEVLTCSDNELKSLDLSENYNLRFVICDHNELTDLNVKNMKNLEVICCYYNDLTTIDTSGDTKLQMIICWDNKITDLDLSDNVNLTMLECANNELSDLNLSNNPNLIELHIGGNEINELDITSNTSLLERIKQNGVFSDKYGIYSAEPNCDEFFSAPLTVKLTPSFEELAKSKNDTTPSTPNTPSTPSKPSEPSSSSTSSNTAEQAGGGFEDFVERLYVVALGRASEPEGKEFWCTHVGNGDLNGAQCANEFLLSKEFKDRSLSNEEFLTVLYKTFFDRDAAADPDGFNFWMNCLKTQGRDSVVDCFINSEEWCNVCASYGVKSGATRAKATIASQNATDFATRLYTCCLGRTAEEEGLKFWSLGLTNLEVSGYEAAKQFFESAEFKGFNTSDEEYLRRLYTTFMGREADTDGLNYWLKTMGDGMSREQVLIEFAKSKEFSEICNTYAINRGI